jgi:hypothetical protein
MRHPEKKLNKATIILTLSLLLTFLGTGHAPLSNVMLPPPGVTVDTFTDSNAPAFRACTSSANDCSLRGAISLSNATTGGIGTIFIPAGIYTLSIPGANEGINETGSLDIMNTVTLQGAGAGSTIIQAGTSAENGIDRVFFISMVSGNVNMNDLTVRWGRVSSGGGGGAGIYHEFNDCILLLERVSIEENHVTVEAAGGGILSGGALTIRDSLIMNNSTVSHEGGGIYDFIGTMTIENSTISGNYAGTYGGGIANQSTAVLRNVTVSGNNAGSGGGGITQWNDGNLTLYNSTIANNFVTGGSPSGWAVYDSRVFNAYNSILASANGSHPCQTSIDAGDHNIATDSTCGAGFTVIDPRLGPLSAHGLTWLHTLLLGSPAIDAGDNATCEPYDQRGISRPIDGNKDGSAICDIGAFEALPMAGFLPFLIKP